MSAAIKAKAVYLNVGGSYSSSLEVQHKIALAIGSTAGYKHNFVAGNIAFYNIGNKKVSFSSYTNKVDHDGSFKGYRHLQKILKSTNAQAHKNGDIVLSDLEADKKFDIFMKKPNVYITSSGDVKDVLSADKMKITGGDHPKYLVSMSGVITSEGTLQKNEVVIYNSPTKFRDTDTNKVALVQGPSLIGVHANDNEDAEVKKFST